MTEKNGVQSPTEMPINVEEQKDVDQSVGTYLRLQELRAQAEPVNPVLAGFVGGKGPRS